MPGPAVVRQVGHQDFPAPDGAVGTVAGAVQGDADAPFPAPVFGQAGGDVGVMVLDSNQGRLFKPEGITGAQVKGMQVVGHDIGVLAA